MSEMEERIAEMGSSPGTALAKQIAIHAVVWLVAFSLFAATDSWSLLTGWSLASMLNILTGIVAGFATVNLVHEWSHYLGARITGARYTVAEKPGLFVFDWDFEANSLGKFYIMSIAGSVGGALAVLLLFSAVMPDNPGRAALLAGAIAAFVLGGIIEWPVLLRTRRSRDPMRELSKISPGVLGSALAGSAASGIVSWLTLV